MQRQESRIEEGRAAFERRAWGAAYDAFVAARDAGALTAGDQWRLAQAAYLVGRDDDFVAALTAAQQAYLDARESAKAARCAFWIGFHLGTRSEHAAAGGWFGRATRLLEDEGGDCAEQGYMLLPAGHHALMTGDADAAERLAARAAAIGQRFHDADLLALALHLQGRALLRQERVAEGLALLDEAMIAVTGDELSPAVTGLIYCSVIGACREVYALTRAQEWTSALSEWCERQPDMVPYAGECRVHRAELLQLHGAWSEAEAEARRAEAHLARAQPGVVGLAAYQRGEVLRLRGELAAAEEAYAAAAHHGREPQPGLALLRLAQGDADAALAGIRRALAEARQPFQRARLLPAAIRILLDTDSLDEAIAACDELARIADTFDSATLRAVVAQERGAIALAAGDAASGTAGDTAGETTGATGAAAALPLLREACRAWQQIDAPYEAARVRTLLGRACRALGDEDGATIELDAARATLGQVGAATDLARLDALAGRGGSRDHGLTPRQRDVLALLATGRTNRDIAARLFISEKTVARHVADIFRTLGVSSRAAATAYAYRHDLLRPSA